MTATLERITIDGNAIWVEIDDMAIAVGKTSKTSKTSTSDSTTPVAGLTKVDLATTLRALVAPIHEGLKSVAPEEVSVELMLGLKGEIGLFVAKSEGSASLKVTAKWKFSGTPAKAAA